MAYLEKTKIDITLFEKYLFSEEKLKFIDTLV